MITGKILQKKCARHQTRVVVKHENNNTTQNVFLNLTVKCSPASKSQLWINARKVKIQIYLI